MMTGSQPIWKSAMGAMEEKLQRLEKNAFVLGNLYYFFQGIVLTAVTQISSPKCHQRGFFFALSLIPFLVNGIPLIYVACNYVEVKNALDRYKLEHQRSRSNHGEGREVADDEYRKKLYYFGLFVTAFVMVAFNGVVLFACNSLLCDHTPTLPNVDYDGHCFSVCNDTNKCLKICTNE